MLAETLASWSNISAAVGRCNSQGFESCASTLLTIFSPCVQLVQGGWWVRSRVFEVNGFARLIQITDWQFQSHLGSFLAHAGE